MSRSYRTEQENFWAGDFGDEYLKRNALVPAHVACKVALWTKIIGSCSQAPSTVLELGANIGINMHVLKMLIPDATLTAVEINPTAADILRKQGELEVIEGSLLEFASEKKWNMVFTAGVLIHINPDFLPDVYATMAKHSSRFVCMAEYYSPTPVSLPYRDNLEKLYKRDFAGEFLERHPEFVLRDYGFVYHKDPVFPLDDPTWFLMERRQ